MGADLARVTAPPGPELVAMTGSGPGPARTPTMTTLGHCTGPDGDGCHFVRHCPDHPADDLEDGRHLGHCPTCRIAVDIIDDDDEADRLADDAEDMHADLWDMRR